jgi:undecaprenyl-diphosphatase
VAGIAVGASGYIVMTTILVALGLLLTKVLLDGPVGRWDYALDRWFFLQREATFDAITEWGSMLGDTMAVVGVAAVAVVVLAIGRHWAHIAFLVGALGDRGDDLRDHHVRHRPRAPDRPAPGPGPPTSSFPSGHAAASIVLYVGLALIITSLVRSRFVRTLAWIAAIVLPIFVALSRLYRGMHHPTDVIASVIGALGCLAFAVPRDQDRRGRRRGQRKRRDRGLRPPALDGQRPAAAATPAFPNRPADVEVSP